jgi:hypothetical protein
MSREIDQIFESRMRDLFRKRQEIILLSAEEAMERILNDPQALPLVHSFPDEDFYFLLHSIGAEDALELLSLASNRQWEFLLDSEIWARDRIDLHAATRWLNLLMKADPNRMTRWAVEGQIEFIEYYLYKNIQVALREHDQDPSDLGDGFVSDDDVYYYRLTEAAYGSEEDRLFLDERDAFINEFLGRLSDDDHIVYQKVLLESDTVIPAELEEEIYRLRNVRRAEKGFMPFEEAVGIYQAIRPGTLKSARSKSMGNTGETGRWIPVPLYPAGLLERDNLFVLALEQVEMDGVLRELQAEFAGLCNRIIAADQRIIREKEALKSIVQKACGYVSIGLEVLTGSTGLDPSGRAVSCIQQYPLYQIFQTGYTQVLELKWKAQKWHGESWTQSRGLPLNFWGEQGMGCIGGLMIKKPLYFDNYQTGVLYREFYRMEEIRQMEKALKGVMALDGLLALMDMPALGSSKKFLTWKNALLTLWTRGCLGLPDDSFSPIPLNQFRHFFQELWEADASGRKLKDAVKESFVVWISDRSGLDTEWVIQRCGPELEALFQEIESEYREVSDTQLNERYITLFLLS